MSSWFSALLGSSKAPSESVSSVTLTINGEDDTVPENLPADTRLVDYLRDHKHLTGTKYMCREGTCGSCVVNVKHFDPILKHEVSISVNSCLLQIYACAGLQVETIEGIGNRLNYHPVQKRLADYNGTQCGFCSPGMVMAMYSLLENNEFPPVQDIEESFDGNICRCTGYRSILDAMRSFAGNNKSEHLLELLMKKPCLVNKMNGNTVAIHRQSLINQRIHLKLDNSEWFRPMELKELYEILKANEGKKIKLVVGNTIAGVYNEDGPYDIYIDMKGIQELYQYTSTDTECTIGGNITLSSLIHILGDMEAKSPGFKYCGAVARHIKKVANTNVRNLASWAGNIMTKKAHRDFPSDIFTLFETTGVTITLGHYEGKQQTLSPLQLLSFDTKGWVILYLRFKSLTSKHFFNSYKIMPRRQSVQAYVNGAFLMEIDSSDNWRVSSKPSIVYGGISADFIHASKTENYLTGKKLGDPNILKELWSTLSGEIVPDPNRIIGKPEYRKKLAINLCYKYILGVLPEALSARIKSGKDVLQRPISSGRQVFDTDKNIWPLNEPIPKIEAQVQCSGEAIYIMDIPKPPHTLYAAFVLSTVGNAYLANMDFSEALAMKGVIRCLNYKDIPDGGINNVLPSTILPFTTALPEELFCSSKVHYVGQTMALVIAESPLIAKEAAKLVKISYENARPPVTTLEDGIKIFSLPLPEDILYEVHEGLPDVALLTSPNVIKGEVKTGNQLHVHMETQEALCIPAVNGMTVRASTQWIDGSQSSVAKVLGVEKSRLNFEVSRLGGAFGGKLTRNFYVVAGCALACHLTDRPVFLQMDLETNLQALGKRSRILAQYEVGFDKNGKLTAVKILYYVDTGCYGNDPIGRMINISGKSVYNCANWSIVSRTIYTNLPANTWMRAPGNVETTFVMECIMERIAKFLNKKPWDVKQINLIPKDKETSGSHIGEIMTQLLNDAQVEERFQKIQTYNKNNRWQKKGLSIVPSTFEIDYPPIVIYNAIVSVHKNGGSVSLSHGGIEMGQGINTKVAQTCGYALGIPLDLISVKATNTLTNPNAFCSGASFSSELCCQAVLTCCETLRNRMQPIREKLKNPTWAELVEECFNENIDLCARYMYGPADKKVGYTLYGSICTEISLDVLTGESQIDRVDLIFDCGRSLSPEIDIGQIEGAFVMGLGYHLLEDVKHDPATGKLLTSRLWEYFTPSSTDIPVDFRLTLLRNVANPFGILKSKATGEPPLLLSCSAVFAIQAAIYSARADAGDSKWFQLNSPATVEVVQLACNVRPEDLVYK